MLYTLKVIWGNTQDLEKSSQRPENCIHTSVRTIAAVEQKNLLLDIYCFLSTLINCLSIHIRPTSLQL